MLVVHSEMNALFSAIRSEQPLVYDITVLIDLWLCINRFVDCVGKISIKKPDGGHNKFQLIFQALI